jgi:phage recombination protein Bet
MNGNIQLPPPFLSEQEIDVLRRTLLKQFTDDEQESFIRQCQRTLLDPFSKQIFATQRRSKNQQGNWISTLTIVTSILGLTAIASRTGHYDGCVISWAGKDGVWRGEWLDEEFPVAAKAVVYHKQRTHPEVGIARWEGYVGRKQDYNSKRWEITDFWTRLPDFMLAKCAKAQALRGAFPDQCSNLYISEELQGGISEADEVDDERKVAQNRIREEELLRKAAPGVRVIESKPAKRPTPAEAAAPAEPEPPKPMSAAPPEAPPQEQPDDLDMGQPPAEEPPAETDSSWKFHVIEGLKNPKFIGRTVGDLSIAELQAIEAQWLPKVRAVWDTVNPKQKSDAEAFEAAIAAAKTEKPW